MGTHHQGSDQEIVTLNAFIKLMRASETISLRLSRHLSEHDLTVSQFGVLEALYHLGPLNQKSLAQKLLKSGGNITLVIENLDKLGYITRKRDKNDRRSVIVSLTDEGTGFISTFFPRHLAFIEEEFAVLTREEKLELSRICKKLGLSRTESALPSD